MQWFVVIIVATATSHHSVRLRVGVRRLSHLSSLVSNVQRLKSFVAVPQM